MKANRIPLIAIMGVFCIACLSLGAFLGMRYLATHGNEIDDHSPARQQSMLSTTLEWCQLAPIPASKSEFVIDTTGSMFSRTFRSSFILPQDNLLEWIAASPGLVDSVGDRHGIIQYEVDPGGDAQYAEVTIDFDSGKVETYCYWS
jgi:hypothetical protein